MELELLLIVWILILLFIIIILIYLDITKQYDLLNIILKYASNIISLSIFIYIIFYKNNFKFGSNSSALIDKEITNDEIIKNPYNIVDKNTKYEDITVKELLEHNIKNIQEEIKQLNNDLDIISMQTKKLLNQLNELNKNSDNNIIKKQNLINELKNKINENNQNINKLHNGIIEKQRQLKKYQTDYNSYLPTIINKFLGKLQKKTIDGEIYGEFPPSSGYGQF